MSIGAFERRRHDVSRLEGFSDGVFAFAVTLLVVSLEVPRTFNELWSAMQGFLAFAICFTLLFQVWSRHHTYFRRYGLEDGVTKTVTGVLLFVVLFYVYPLKFLWTLLMRQIMSGSAAEVRMPDGHFEAMIHDDQVWRLFVVYGLGVAAVFASFVALYAHAYHQRERLRLTPVERLETRLSLMSNAGTVIVALVSISIAIVGHLIGRIGVTVMAGYIYVSIGPVEWGIGAYGGRQHERLSVNTEDTSRA